MNFLRIIGIGLNTVGAIILALRVKRIVDMLVNAQVINDANIRVIADLIVKRRQRAPITHGMDEQVQRQQKRGAYLLVLGFLFIATGNILIGISWICDY